MSLQDSTNPCGVHSILQGISTTVPILAVHGIIEFVNKEVSTVGDVDVHRVNTLMVRVLIIPVIIPAQLGLNTLSLLDIKISLIN